MRQGEQSITSFYNAIKASCDELQTIDEPITSRDRVTFLQAEFEVNIKVVRSLNMWPEFPNFNEIRQYFLHANSGSVNTKWIPMLTKKFFLRTIKAEAAVEASSVPVLPLHTTMLKAVIISRTTVRLLLMN